MLDKKKTYAGYSLPRIANQSPSQRFYRVKILYEDDVSFYVESLTMNKDKKGHNRRYSAKKHNYVFIDVNKNHVPEICKSCPLHQASKKYEKVNR